MVLQIIDTAATALTLRPPNDSPSEIDRYEYHLTQWLYNSEPTEEPSPAERVSGPLLISQPTAPSAATSNAALPINRSNVASTGQPQQSHSQSFPAQYTGEPPATYSAAGVCHVQKDLEPQRRTFLTPTPVNPHKKYQELMVRILNELEGQSVIVCVGSQS